MTPQRAARFSLRPSRKCERTVGCSRCSTCRCGDGRPEIQGSPCLKICVEIVALLELMPSRHKPSDYACRPDNSDIQWARKHRQADRSTASRLPFAPTEMDVFLVDDNSADDTIDVVREHQSLSPNGHALPGRKLGFALQIPVSAMLQRSAESAQSTNIIIGLHHARCHR